MAEDLIADLLGAPAGTAEAEAEAEAGQDDRTGREQHSGGTGGEQHRGGTGGEQHRDDQDPMAGDQDGPVADRDQGVADDNAGDADGPAVYGDNAYGTGPFHDRLEQGGIGDRCKTQSPSNTGGRLSKDAFEVDLDAEQVRCPAGKVAPIRRGKNGAGTASFGPACADCPLRRQCTTAAAGRTISVGAYEPQLADARQRQRDPDWVADYRGTRPKVERKIGHLMRRTHGGRRARVRGTTKVAADFALLAAAVNLARLGVLAVAYTTGRGWATTTG